MTQTTYPASLVPSAVFEAALLHLRANNIMTGLVSTFNDRQGLTPRTGSRWGEVTWRQRATTDDTTASEFTRTALGTLTPYVWAPDPIFIADEDLRTDTEDTLAAAAQEFGQGAAQKVETNLLGMFSSFTGGTVGTAGSAITWAYWRAMRDRLDVASKGVGQKIFVCHTYQWGVLSGLAPTSSVAIVQPAIVDQQIVTAFGLRQVDDVLIYPTPNVSVITGDDAYAGMFVMDALAFDLRTPFNIRPQRDESRGGGGTELNASMTYGYGVWDATKGIQGIFDCTAPTGT